MRAQTRYRRSRVGIVTMMAVHVSIGRMKQVRFVWCSTATDLISYSESFRWGSRCRHRATQTWCMRYPGYLHRAVSNARTTLWESDGGGAGRETTHSVTMVEVSYDRGIASTPPLLLGRLSHASRMLLPRSTNASLMLLPRSTNASPTFDAARSMPTTPARAGATHPSIRLGAKAFPFSSLFNHVVYPLCHGQSHTGSIERGFPP